jgi:polysaccharide export outer membrane protein
VGRQPDDFWYLPSALSTEIYVLGAVTEPRAVSFKDQVTLSSAIATARGTPCSMPGFAR